MEHIVELDSLRFPIFNYKRHPNFALTPANLFALVQFRDHLKGCTKVFMVADYEGVQKEVYQNKSSSYITGSSNGTPSQSTTNTQCAYNDIDINASHIAKVLLGAVTSLSLVAVPRVSYYMKNQDYIGINNLIDKSFSIVSFLAFPVAMGLCCISPTFVPLFFGDKFVGAIIPLMILSFLVIAIGLNNLTGVQILIGMGHDKPFLYSVLIGTFSNFILNLALIPLWGAVGASIASLVAEFLILLVTTVFVYHRTPFTRQYNFPSLIYAFFSFDIFLGSYNFALPTKYAAPPLK